MQTLTNERGGAIEPAYLPVVISSLDMGKKLYTNETLHNICVSGITRSIRRLNLASTRIADRGLLELLTHGIHVKCLNLTACHQLTEKGLSEFFKNVRGLKKLMLVCLRGVTNRSLTVLIERKEQSKDEDGLPLKVVDISGCKFVTKGCMTGFRAVYPSCNLIATNLFA